MKVEWKVLSLIDQADQNLLHLKIRTESDLVLSRADLAQIVSKWRSASDSSVHIERTERDQWLENFAEIEAVFRALSDVPRPVRRLRLETPWREWSAKKYREVEQLLVAAVGSKAFISIAGEPPNLDLSLRVGTTHLLHPLSEAQAKADAAIFSSVTEEMLEGAAEAVKAGHSLPREAAIALGIGVAAVGLSIGGVTLGSIVITALAAEVLTAAQVIQILAAAATTAAAAAKIYEQYNEQQRLKQEQLDREAEKAREEVREALDAARRETMLAMNFEDGKYGGIV